MGEGGGGEEKRGGERENVSVYWLCPLYPKPPVLFPYSPLTHSLNNFFPLRPPLYTASHDALSSCDYEASSLNALELGLPKFIVNLDMEHDFIGKANLVALRDAGVAAAEAGATRGGELAGRNPGAKRLVAALAFDTEGALPPMSEAWSVRGADDDSGEAGLLTSLGHSPRVGKYIAVASVPAHLADPDTVILVDTPKGTETARVAALPFPGTESPLHRG